MKTTYQLVVDARLSYDKFHRVQEETVATIERALEAPDLAENGMNRRGLLAQLRDVRGTG